MKKIIILALIMALCTACFASCIPSGNNNSNSGGSSDPLAEVAKMYSQSAPTKIVASTKQTIASVELDCTYELINGTVDSFPASVYTVYTEEIESIENGGGTDVIKPLIKSTTRKTEAIQGIGSRVDGGDWDPEGIVYTINRGGMAINLDKESVTNVKYEDKVLTFTIPVVNAGTVLGQAYVADIGSDVQVTIVTDGAVVTSIELHYSLKANAEVNLVQSEMVVKVDYTYDIEKITIS